ncbi:MAG TPA: hemerythrin domain-containing protein [Polyangiaceae bacterium]|nr:hemerythrin domain-containing protein [Polyangiaceae bacterium]
MEPLATIATLFRPSGAGPSVRGRLDATLVKVADLYTGLAAGRADVDPRGVLAALRVDLELHFALEEGDAYFGAFVRERPELAHGVAELREEHTALLEKLDGLRAMASALGASPELAEPTARLVEAFREHEHKEADLLQEAVLRDEGTGAD